MATTSPDNLFSPNPSDNYNLIADWATSMQSVQTAFVKRANMYVGTAAQRAAFTTAPDGVHWQDTDGTRLEYTRSGATWVRSVPEVKPPLTGEATVTSTGNGGTVVVNFPAGSFTAPPLVFLTKQSPSLANFNPYVSTKSATSVTIGVYSNISSTGSVPVAWMAIGQ